MTTNHTTRACDPWRASAGAECTCSDRHTGIWEIARWKEAHHASMSSSVSAARRKYFAPVMEVTYATPGGLRTLRWLKDEKEGVLDIEELPRNLWGRRSQYAKGPGLKRTGGDRRAVLQINCALDGLHAVILCVGDVRLRQSEPPALPILYHVAELREPALRETILSDISTLFDPRTAR